MSKSEIGATICEEHRDRCSIPQGCPFSMTMIALLMVPWINLMRELKVGPRVLADDLMFTAHGVGHRANTIRAMDASRHYFHDRGAKVANLVVTLLHGATYLTISGMA